jgi:hypothetical protein
MARGSGFSVGNTPPMVTWTVVRGDTASFRAYVTDDNKQPLDISAWSINMTVKRPTTSQKIVSITDDATVVLNLFPEATDLDGAGEFTVALSSAESNILETGDIFDVQLSDSSRVWTVCQGSMIILEDVTE